MISRSSLSQVGDTQTLLQVVIDEFKVYDAISQQSSDSMSISRTARSYHDIDQIPNLLSSSLHDPVTLIPPAERIDLPGILNSYHPGRTSSPAPSIPPHPRSNCPIARTDGELTRSYTIQIASYSQSSRSSTRTTKFDLC